MTERRVEKEAFAPSSSTIREDYTMSEGNIGLLEQSDTNNEENGTQRSVANRKRRFPFNRENTFGTESAEVKGKRYSSPSDGEKVLVKLGGKVHLVRKKEVNMIMSHVKSNIDTVKNIFNFKRKKAKIRNSYTDGISMDQASTGNVFYGTEKHVEHNVSWSNLKDLSTVPKELNKGEEFGEKNRSRIRSKMEMFHCIPNNTDMNTWLQTSNTSINRKRQVKSYPEQNEFLSAQSHRHQSHLNSTIAREMNGKNPSHGYNGWKKTMVNGFSQTCENGQSQIGLNRLSQTDVNGFSPQGTNGLPETEVNGLSQTGVNKLSRTGVNGLSQTGVNGLCQRGVNGLPQTGVHGLKQTGLNGLSPTRVNGQSQIGINFGLTQADLEKTRKQARILFFFHAYRNAKKNKKLQHRHLNDIQYTQS